jgi:hypothetical protein
MSRARHAPAGLGKPGCPPPPRPATEQVTPVPGKKGLRHPPGSSHPPRFAPLPRPAMVRSQVAASRVLPAALVERGVTTFAVNTGIWLMAAPEFDKGTLARTLIGPCGQVTGLPDRRQAYGPSPLVKFLHSQRYHATAIAEPLAVTARCR